MPRCRCRSAAIRDSGGAGNPRAVLTPHPHADVPAQVRACPPAPGTARRRRGCGIAFLPDEGRPGADGRPITLAFILFPLLGTPGADGKAGYGTAGGSLFRGSPSLGACRFGIAVDEKGQKVNSHTNGLSIFDDAAEGNRGERSMTMPQRGMYPAGSDLSGRYAAFSGEADGRACSFLSFSSSRRRGFGVSGGVFAAAAPRVPAHAAPPLVRNALSSNINARLHVLSRSPFEGFRMNPVAARRGRGVARTGRGAA